MAEKRNWLELSHEERIAALKGSSYDQIVTDYDLPGIAPAEFKRRIAAEASLWQAANIGQFEEGGGPPTKDMILGAYRDLDRSEAILELIDNSIDAWLSRRSSYPKASAPTLEVYVDIDPANGRLIYEDNAGGVKREKLQNLVVPGYSDTTAFSETIGSYKTGGKKAIFRLATAARLDTRYWNPVGTSDEAFSIQLDEAWIGDASRYKFPYALLQDSSVLERGQTIYTLQLHEEPKGAPWYSSPEQRSKIEDAIRRTYSLLLIRHPQINLHFNDRKKPLEPVADLYDFTGAHEAKAGLDVRPQRVKFELELEHDGTKKPIIIELVIGCRTTTGMTDGKSWGFDLYGNDRLFVPYEQETFADDLPKGNVQRRIRGYVNILGPNVFIPWDTHKRHLNHDREIMQILRTHPLIKKVFKNWKDAFQQIADLVRGEGTHSLSKRMTGIFDKNVSDLVIPHEGTLKIDAARKKGVELPDGFYAPRVKGSKKCKKDGLVIKFSITTDDARLLMTFFDLEGEIDAGELSRVVRDDVIERAMRPSDPRERKRGKSKR